jgi:hypothetical protein
VSAVGGPAAGRTISSPSVPALGRTVSSPSIPALGGAGSKPGMPAVGGGSKPGVPAVGAPRPPTASSPSELSDDKLRVVYDAYVAAKRRNKEDTSKMSFDSVASSLRKQVPELLKQHNAKSVEFKVVIKDGKAVLKAVPK